MDARQLEYFLAIVDHDGFGRAAQHLHVAQPSLSQAIANLERELRVQLFHRISRGAVLSTAGTELIAPARQVLRDLRTARATMESAKGLRRGTVELVTMPSPGIEPLSALTRQFTRRFPGLTIDAAAAFTPGEVIDKVRQGSASWGWSAHRARSRRPASTSCRWRPGPAARDRPDRPAARSATGRRHRTSAGLITGGNDLLTR
jgi:DNA-binding transcriptional LysR family regulator